MPEPCTVIITSQQPAPSLRDTSVLQGEVLTFGDAEFLQALEAITARQPALIAFDLGFASSARGRALAERLKRDPLLAASSIVVLLKDGTTAPFAATSSPAMPSVQYIDHRGTRRAQRVAIRPGVQVLVDGRDAKLVDLSLVGAQILSPTVVRPNKIVRIVMPDESALVQVNGVIVWARFETVPGQPSPHYRAGISFKDPDPAAVQRYCTKQRA